MSNQYLINDKIVSDQADIYIYIYYIYICIYFYNDTLSDIDRITDGVPQGSILDPLLYILYMNDFSGSLNLLFSNLFADHTNIILEVLNCKFESYSFIIIMLIFTAATTFGMYINTALTTNAILELPMRYMLKCTTSDTSITI